jgi:hypothetical protein
MDAGVGNQVEDAAVAGHFLDAHLDTGVHGADKHIDLVALDQAVGVFDALGRLGLVVHLEPLDLASAQLAAFFVDGHAHAVLDGHAQLGEGAGVRQHQSHTHLVALRAGDLRQKQPGGGRADEGGATGEDEAASGHFSVSLSLGSRGGFFDRSGLKQLYRCGARRATWLSLSAAAARSLKRWILPVAVFGSSGTNAIQRGYL